MNTELNPIEKQKAQNIYIKSGGGDTVYALGMIGACVYYIGKAKTFREGVIGFLKALVWPAFVVYELLKFLGM